VTLSGWVGEEPVQDLGEVASISSSRARTIVAPRLSNSALSPTTSTCILFFTDFGSGTGLIQISGPWPAGSPIGTGQSSGRGLSSTCRT